MAFRNARSTSGLRSFQAWIFGDGFHRNTYSAASPSDFDTAGELGRTSKRSRASPSGATIQRGSGCAVCENARGVVAQSIRYNEMISLKWICIAKQSILCDSTARPGKEEQI